MAKQCKPPKIYYADSKKTMGYYDERLNVIVLPNDISEYGELGDFIYKHEMKHWENWNQKKFILKRLFYDVYIEYRDRYKIFTDLEMNYNFHKMMVKRRSLFIYMFFYLLLSTPSMLYYLMGIINLIRYKRRNKK